MKLLCLIFTISTSLTSLVQGKIKNGYLDIEHTREALRSLIASAHSETKLNRAQARRVNERIRILREHVIHFELTEKLLQQFRIIAPNIYNEIDSITDKDGKSTDVFIKFIPKETAHIQHPGITHILYDQGDNTCYSEYGRQTASVQVWVMDNSLTILAHELGHVKYQVPNLAIYDAYHKLNYRSLTNQPNYIGHNAGDVSGRSASSFEGRFIQDRRVYLKATVTKLETPFKLLAGIKKRYNTNPLVALN